jgi:ATP-binding cassette, subfamily B, bacterial MsbA
MWYRQPMTSLPLYRRLLGESKPYRGVFGLAVLMLLVVALTEPLLPIIFQRLLDGAFQQQTPTLPTSGALAAAYASLQASLRAIPLHWLPGLVVLAFLVRGIANYLGDYALSWVGNRVVMDMRSRLFEHVLRLPTRFFDQSATANLVSKITFDINNVAQASTQAVTILVQDTATLIFLLLTMYLISPKLTLVALTVAPLVGVVVRLLSKRLRRASVGLQDSMGELTARSEQAMSGQKIVKLYEGFAQEKAHFHTAANHVRRFTMKQAAATAAGVPISHLFVSVAIAAVLWLAIGEAKAGVLTAGSFMAFLVALTQLLTPLKRLTNVNSVIQRGLAAAEAVYEVLDRDIELDKGTQPLARARGEIVFDQVSLRYGDERLALDQVSLHIKAGETIALVGASGGGKTSLAHLLPRFYSPLSGRILLDGEPIENYRLSDCRSQMALVSQEVVLFNDTVAANIAYSKPGASQAEIEQAAQAAHADGFINAMPQGYQSVIGERGGRLSGGQKQRIAIARALLKNAPILILDEATSALDNESERAVQAALETLIKGRTTLIIAHRLSTIERADRIVVMDAGRIVEVGSHSELLAQGGVYSHLQQLSQR